MFQRDKGLLINIATWSTVALSAQTQGPAWWSARGAVDANLPPNDYALITQGQLKWMAAKACAEMNAYSGAGANVTAVVAACSNSKNIIIVDLKCSTVL